MGRIAACLVQARLVQEITRQRLPDDQKRDILDPALAILDGGLPAPEWNQKGWQLWEQLAPHCRTLLNRLQDHVLEPKAMRIMSDLAIWLNNRAEHGEAEPLFRRALARGRKSGYQRRKVFFHSSSSTRVLPPITCSER